MPNSSLVPLLRRTYWLSVLAILVTAGTVATVALVQRDRERWARHSREVVRMARRAHLTELDRETGVRGFLLGGDSASLASDLAARVPLRAMLDSLIAATADTPAQQRRAGAYAAAITHWETAFAQPTLTQRSQFGSSAEPGTTLAGRDPFAGTILFGRCSHAVRRVRGGGGSALSQPKRRDGSAADTRRARDRGGDRCCSRSPRASSAAA